MNKISTFFNISDLKIAIHKFCLVLFGFFLLNSVYSQGRITSITPSAAPVDATVTINGNNFDTTPGKYFVYVGGVRASVKAATASTLTVTIPPGASDNFVTVTANRFTSYSLKPVVITFPGGIKISQESLETKFDLPAGGPVKTAAADFNADGKADLVIANFQSKSVTVYKNNAKPGILGAADFVLELNLTQAGNPVNVATGDLNTDGKQDLVVLSKGVGLFIYTNNSSNGLISFLPPRKLHSGTRLYDVIVHDLDGNGRPDLILSNDSTTGIQIIQNGSATDTILPFGPIISLPTTEMVENISVADIDGDRLPDIAANSKRNDTLTLLRNRSTVGTITFASPVYNSAALLPGNITTGDLNLDGKPDIILTNLSSYNISVLKNLSSPGTFSMASKVMTTTGTGPFAASVADIDGDGRQEVITANQTSNTLAILKNQTLNGSLSLQPGQIFSGGIKPVDVLIADLDADGKQDIVVANEGLNTVSIFRNKVAEVKLLQAGASPVSGPVTQKLIIDSPVQAYNGQPYVQRHYDIEPEENPSTSTATVSLYYTQEEFNNYNNFPGLFHKLPNAESDSAGKSHLRVFQYHGTSATSMPGTYSGESVEIDPDDSNVTWNPTEERWEVSFDINGFSGFFVGSAGYAVLPYRLTSFSASLQQNKSILTWQTSDEIDVSYFELQRSSAAGSGFITIGRIDAVGTRNRNIYRFTDDPVPGLIYYYRLRTIDSDSSFSYSKIVMLGSSKNATSLTIYPNPVTGSVTLKHPLSNKARIQLVDGAGRVIHSVPVASNITETRLDVSRYSPGIYCVRYMDGNTVLLRSLHVKIR